LFSKNMSANQEGGAMQKGDKVNVLIEPVSFYCQQSSYINGEILEIYLTERLLIKIDDGRIGEFKLYNGQWHLMCWKRHEQNS